MAGSDTRVPGRYGYLCLVVCLCIGSIGKTSGFNLDIRTALTQQGDPGSMFGYSVSMYSDGSSNW